MTEPEAGQPGGARVRVPTLVPRGGAAGGKGKRPAAPEPAVAVIMSTYARDDATLLDQAIESILAQTHSNLRLYVAVDGPVPALLGSTVRSWPARDSRICVRWREQNDGLANALNELIDGVLAAGFEFIARMDADDESRAERMAQQVAFLEAHPEVDVVGTWCEEVGPEGKHFGVKRLPVDDPTLKQRLLVRCPFVHPTVMFRARALAGGARYATDSHLTEDMFLWVDLARRGHKFANVGEVLLRYRVTTDFYRKRGGWRKAKSEYRAKRYIARELEIGGLPAHVIPVASFAMRLLPPPLLRQCYRYLR